MTLANIRGIELSYEVIGTDGPWLLLISGGRRAYREFVPLAMKIAAEGFRVLLHDRRNTGASQIVTDGEQGEEEIWTDDIAALVDHLGIGPVFVGGASSGARTSMLTYLRHPEVVRALILMRVTGGEFAAGRLPPMYYGDLIRAAREGGMAAVCATEQYKERIAAYPASGPYLMGPDTATQGSAGRSRARCRSARPTHQHAEKITAAPTHTCGRTASPKNTQPKSAAHGNAVNSSTPSACASAAA